MYVLWDINLVYVFSGYVSPGAARIAFLGYNNLKPSEALSLPKVKKIIGKNEIQTGILKDRFLNWKSFYLGKNV